MGPRGPGPKGPLGPNGGPRAQMGPWAQRAQGPIWIPNLGPGLQFWGLGLAPGPKIWPLGLNISKLPLEKPCRMQWSTFQTEPYVASYGRKPFRAGWGKFHRKCVCRQNICCVIVSADISQDIPQAFYTQWRPLRGRPVGGKVGGDVLGDVC